MSTPLIRATRSLGNVNYERGDYDQALDWCRKALLIFEKILPPDLPPQGTAARGVAGGAERVSPSRTHGLTSGPAPG